MISGLRRCVLLGWIGAACTAGSTCESKPASPVETPISILQLNMRGVSDVPNGDRNGFWVTRYRRIGADLKSIGATPDVIALQEVTARLWCPDNHNFILDYETLRTLLESLQATIGVRYRIAYLQTFARERRMGDGPTSMGGTLRECYGTSGLALLYNPDRLKNLYTDIPETVALGTNVAAFNQDFTRPKLRRSMPCCAGKVRPGHEGVCALLDGPIQTDVCGVATPGGLAQHVTGDVAAVAFELALRRNTTFHVYNVHLPWRGSNGYAETQQAVRALLNSLEINEQRWFPPVMVGDFNNEPEFIQEWLTDFDSLGGAPLDAIIHTMLGKPAVYNSSATAARFETIGLPSGSTQPSCGDTDRLWSDHCGALTTLWIREN